MNLVGFDQSHVESARLIVMENYYEEREAVPCLPEIDLIPELEYFAENGLGVAAMEDDRLIGFLCCYEPWENAFDSTAKGTFSPLHAHGTIKENRPMIYKRMYQYAAEKLVKQKVTYHGITLYAHDTEALDTFFTYGFGLRCIDAIRPMSTVDCKPCEGIRFGELAKDDVCQARELRKLLSEHLGTSPCFMYSTEEEFLSWLNHAEGRDSRLFAAKDGEKTVAFIEVTSDGENFATGSESMRNICGAYCLPEYRGKDICQNLLNEAICKLAAEGYTRLGVDFESFNPTAYGFWMKSFTAYTKSVVRRIDEGVLRAYE